MSIHGLLQAMSQISGPLTLFFNVIRDSLNQRIANGNSMPHKDNKGRGNTTHHILGNQSFQEPAARAKCSNTSVQTSSHLRARRHEVLVSKTHKSGSPGADILSNRNG